MTDRQREIKFRAWHKQAGQMLDSPYGGEFATEITPLNGVIEDAVENEHQVLMQYTGLHDKNGVEIYEGDICNVRPMRDNNNDGDEGQVYYFSGVWWLGNPEFGGYHLHNMVKYTEDTAPDLSSYLGNVVEVIGNIYENPELLEQQHVA